MTAPYERHTMLIDLLTIFIDNIVPILMCAGIGLWVGRSLQIDPVPIGRLIFYIFSPMLIFYSLYTSEVGGEEFVYLVIATITFQVTMMALAWGVMRVQGVADVPRANVMISAFCLNAGNFGLPLVTFAFGNDVLSRALVVMVANTFTNYTLGVYIASNGRASAREAFINVLKTPGMYALIIAFVLREAQITLPTSIDRTTSLLAQASIPLMLVMLGLQLGQSGKRAPVRLVSSGVMLKLIIAPMLAITLATLFGMNEWARIAFILQTSMPTAVATIIFATQFDLDRDLQLNIILATTLISPFTLAPLILWLGG